MYDITITVIVALLMNRKESFAKKVEVFTKGAGHSNIILMMLIFILAGAFSNTAEKIGSVKSTVNLGLSLIPENLIIVGLFVICMFVSISMGTYRNCCCNSTCWLRICTSDRCTNCASNGYSCWRCNVRR